MHNEKPNSVGSIRPESASKLSKPLHLDPLAWLLEREVFYLKLATGLQDVLANLKDPEASGKDENEANESDDFDSDHDLHDSDSEHNIHDDSASSDEPAPTDKED